MRMDDGQASVEWIGTLLLVALAAAALARFADRVDGTGVATAALETTSCAAGGGCETGTRGTRPRRAVTVPPPLPVVLRPERRPRTPSRVRARARRGVGTLWRRAWFVCLAYERGRYGVVHPEFRASPSVPPSGALQMVNDCVSPVDFSRDRELLLGR